MEISPSLACCIIPSVVVSVESSEIDLVTSSNSSATVKNDLVNNVGPARTNFKEFPIIEPILAIELLVSLPNNVNFISSLVSPDLTISRILVLLVCTSLIKIERSGILATIAFALASTN